jgi:hypothetical protein
MGGWRGKVRKRVGGGEEERPAIREQQIAIGEVE